MPISFLFWLIYVLAVIFGAFGVYRFGGPDPNSRYMLAGNSLLVMVLLFLLGWKVFGFVIQG